MRLVPAFVLALSLVSACDKKEGGGGFGSPPPADPVAKGTDPAKADPGKPAVAPADPAKAEPPPPPPAPKPVMATGVLDLDLQEVPGGWKIITPRYTQFFTSKPNVARQDAQTPFGDTIPGAVAMVEGNDRFGGLIYIPIPKDIPYDVKKGLKGARDGMLGMFDGKYDAKDEVTTLGGLEANHVTAEGSREGHRFHVEAWIAYDPVGRTVYGLMALRMPSDLEGISKMRDGFELRPDAKPGEKGAATDDAGSLDKVIKKEAAKAAPKAPAPAAKADPL